MRQLIANDCTDGTAHNRTVSATEPLPGQRTNTCTKQSASSPLATGMSHLMSTHAASKQQRADGCNSSLRTDDGLNPTHRMRRQLGEFVYCVHEGRLSSRWSCLFNALFEIRTRRMIQEM